MGITSVTAGITTAAATTSRIAVAARASMPLATEQHYAAGTGETATDFSQDRAGMIPMALLSMITLSMMASTVESPTTEKTGHDGLSLGATMSPSRTMI